MSPPTEETTTSAPSKPPAGELRPGLDTWDQVIDWEGRFRREGNGLLRWLESSASRRLLDLGSATGEYAAWLASHGFEVVGIEGNPARWESARSTAPAGVEHLAGDLGAVEAMVDGQFGGAVCLGDTLACLLGVESLSRMLVGLRRRLLPGAPFVAQLQNWERLRRGGVEALPVRVRARSEGDLVFLRLLDLRDDGVVDVTETTLRHRPLADRPVELLASRPVFLQGWTREQLETVLEVARFGEIRAYGGFDGSDFQVDESPELVLVAR